MVFCYQNCSDLLWEKKCFCDWEKLLKFEAEGWEFANILRSLEQFIQTVKGQNSNWKKIGFRNMQERLEKIPSKASFVSFL